MVRDDGDPSRPGATGPLVVASQRAFYNDVLGELVSLLQNVVGLAEAEGFVSTVGTRIGAQIGERYALTGDRPDQGQVAARIGEILVDLKARIGGGFRVHRLEGTQIVLVNDRCPFGDMVRGRSAFCMMTTNVFGKIASDQAGYARVEVQEALAKGDARCLVVVDLAYSDDPDRTGYEFFHD